MPGISIVAHTVNEIEIVLPPPRFNPIAARRLDAKLNA
jgi:hypothetical protein